MKILILANPDSVHTFRWVASLAEEGLDILLFGFNSNNELYKNMKSVKLFSLHLNNDLCIEDNQARKISYFKAMPQIKKIIKIHRPDLVHAHYLSSYGLIGAFLNFHPFAVSVWGSDIFDFPKRSFMHKLVTKFVLYKADYILSTSHAMARETSLYAKGNVEVTPFGIDIQQFKNKTVASVFHKNDIVLGTIKSLDVIYGVEFLIKAFKIVKDKHPAVPLKLLIVGDGEQEKYLKNLAKQLKINSDTVFTGKVPHSDVVSFHNMISIFVNVSLRESFGVSVLEASACEKPVVVSNVGGLPEVVEDGVTGIIVPPEDEYKTAEAVELLLDEKIREKMGRAGRERVLRMFNWEDNVTQMKNIYDRLAGTRGRPD